MLAGDRPGIKENHFDIKQQEGHGDQMKADIEAASGIVNGVHAALVRHLLHSPLATRPNQPSQDQHANG
jgi:hypothetical protein